MRDLHAILRDPYQLNHGDPLSMFKVLKPSAKIDDRRYQSSERSLTTLAASNSNTASTQHQGAKSVVPFGSRSLRPIGEVPLNAITEFTYIPDMRRLQAINTV